MSSLLRRLVRPAGEIRHVRPTAALPYQSAPAFDDVGLDAPAPSAASMAPPPLVAEPPRATPSARSPASPNRAKPDTSPPGRASAPAHHEPAASTPVIETPPDTAPPWAPPAPLMAERIEHPPTGTGVSLGIQPPTQDTTEALPDASAPATGRGHPAGKSARSAPPEAGTAPRPNPSPLFRPQAREQTAPLSHRPQGPEANRIDAGATADETPEIHVHIGRIEVTALPQTAAPQPKRRQGKSPMSLDDYLARKRGGAA